MAKMHWIAGVVAVVVLGGASVYAYNTVNDNSRKNVRTHEQAVSTSNSSTKSSTVQSSNQSSISDVSSYASSKAAESTDSAQSFKPAGEMAEAAASYSSVMTADSGVAITNDMVTEAREQLKEQGVDAGAFPDQSIAEVINKANNESVDYATAIKELYPNYFAN